MSPLHMNVLEFIITEIAMVFAFYFLVNNVFRWKIDRKLICFGIPVAAAAGFCEPYIMNLDTFDIRTLSIYILGLILAFAYFCLAVGFTEGKLWKRIIVVFCSMQISDNFVIYMVRLTKVLEFKDEWVVFNTIVTLIGSALAVGLLWIASFPGRKDNTPKIDVPPIAISYGIFQVAYIIIAVFGLELGGDDTIQPQFLGVQISVDSMRFLLQLYNGFGIILFLGLIFGMLFTLNFYMSQRYFRRAAHVNESFLEAQSKYYESIDEKYKEIRSLRHDYKNHLTVLALLLESDDIDKAKEYIYEISDSLSSSNTLCNTGNSIADAIISEKIKKATLKNAKISIEGVFSHKSMKAIDICTILGNILDNAIEAVRPGDSISLEFKKTDSFFMISSSNKCRQGLKYDGSVILTSKKTNRELHGLGIGNIRTSAAKYNGDVNVTCLQNKENNNEYMFSINVMIPISE